jgi:NTP pyrophosphatase (non-canonical NTP hydrolase)
MIRFIFKAILRDKNRSVLPVSVVAIGVMLTIALSGYLSGALGDMIDQTARFQTGHVKVMSRAYADNIDQMPNDLALLGIDKVHEELNELKVELEANDKEKAAQEFGDFIFALVNAARHEDIVAEEALQITNKKFYDRFRYIEERSAENGKELSNMTLEEMDELWDEAKSKGL